MASEVIRCTDCGAAFKAVPAWLATAKVKFTCTNCPKRPSRAIARFEPAPVIAAVEAEPLEDLDVPEIEDIDEDTDLELAADDLDELKDDKEV